MSINAIKSNSLNNVNFKANERTKKEKITYKRTDAYKIAGAIAGGTLGIGIAAFFHGFNGKTLGNTEIFKFSALGNVITVLGGAIMGGLFGTFTDIKINKTVKNVVASLKQNDIYNN